MTIPTAAEVLKETFGLEGFRPGQADVVAAQMEGRDVLSVAPTGSGKSVSYWVPAVAGGGLTLVVSPLIALMKDQVDRLQSLRVAASFINSTLTRGEQVERLRRAAAGEYRLLYLAPERFARPGFLDRLAELRIRRMVVDEAHCISTWGHDFRPDYRRMGQALEACGNPPVAAFTATATPPVREDIARNLSLRQPLISVTGFNRPNLRLEVRRCRGEGQKQEALRSALASEPGRAIVYTGTVRSAEELAARLSAGGRPAAAYHGRLAEEARRQTHNAFAAGQLEVMVATSAFGMGVDFPDIRQVIHFHLPGSLEAYYQEAGRAGRDGRPALCLLLYSPADRDLQTFFIERAHPEPDDVVTTYQVLRRAGFWSVDVEELRSELPDRAFRSLEATRLLLHNSNLLNPDGSVAVVESLSIDFDQIARLKQHAYARLGQMTGYAELRSCRHARITDHFGERTAPTCSACDNCLTPLPSEVTIETESVRAALTCIARFNGRLGSVNLATILRGRENRWTRSQGWIRELAFHGTLSSWSEERVRALLSELVSAGCASHLAGEYPVLQLTSLGRDVLAGASAVTVTLPEPHTGAASSPAAEPAVDQAQLDRLKSWRTQVARRDEVPAYVVFPDRTLAELASRHPRTREQLLSIPGIGPTKLERYAEDLLAILAPDTA